MGRVLIDRLSRRQFLGGSVVASAALAMHSRAHAQALDKPAVNYTIAPTGADRCRSCLYFRVDPASPAFGSCTMVSGPVEPSAACSIWTGD